MNTKELQMKKDGLRDYDIIINDNNYHGYSKCMYRWACTVCIGVYILNV